MSESLSPEQAARVLAGFGMTRVEAAQYLLLAAVFLDTRIELEHGGTFTVGYREGQFTIHGGETVLHEVESLDEQALQEQEQLELFHCAEAREDSWEPSPPEALRVFMEYDDLTGDFDE